MRIVGSIIVVLVLFLSSALVLAEDKIFVMPPDDPVMIAAIARARATLDQFLWLADHPPARASHFSVDVRISDGAKIEHFWVMPFTRLADHFVGLIAYEPKYVFTVKAHQSHEFRKQDIDDWLYSMNGKIHGGQTIRALLPQMTPETAAHFRSLLADD